MGSGEQRQAGADGFGNLKMARPKAKTSKKKTAAKTEKPKQSVPTMRGKSSVSDVIQTIDRIAGSINKQIEGNPEEHRKGFFDLTTLILSGKLGGVAYLVNQQMCMLGRVCRWLKKNQKEDLYDDLWAAYNETKQLIHKADRAVFKSQRGNATERQLALRDFEDMWNAITELVSVNLWETKQALLERATVKPPVSPPEPEPTGDSGKDTRTVKTITTKSEIKIKPIDLNKPQWWNCKNLRRLRDIDSNPKRDGVPGTPNLLKHLRKYIRKKYREDIAKTLSMNETKDRMLTSMPYNTMFLQK